MCMCVYLRIVFQDKSLRYRTTFTSSICFNIIVSGNSGISGLELGDLKYTKKQRDSSLYCANIQVTQLQSVKAAISR